MMLNVTLTIKTTLWAECTWETKAQRTEMTCPGSFVWALLSTFFQYHPPRMLGFPSGTDGKEPACQCRRHKRRVFHPWVGKIPWRRKWQPTPVFLPGDSHGQRSLVCYSPWCCKRAGHNWSHFTHMHTCFHNLFFFFLNTYNTWL